MSLLNGVCCCLTSGICCTIEFNDDFDNGPPNDPLVNFFTNCTPVENSTECTDLTGVFVASTDCETEPNRCPAAGDDPCGYTLSDFPNSNECSLFAHITSSRYKYCQFDVVNNACVIYSVNTYTSLQIIYSKECGLLGGSSPPPECAVYPDVLCTSNDTYAGCNDVFTDCFSCTKTQKVYVGKINCLSAVPNGFARSRERQTIHNTFDITTQGTITGGDDSCLCNCGNDPQTNPTQVGACCIITLDVDENPVYTCTQTTRLACANLMCEEQVYLQAGSGWFPETSCEASCG